MADYIAYLDRHTIISIEEYCKHFKDTRPAVYCLCGRRLYYRDNSYDDNMKIKRYKCFFHEKGSTCNINKIMNEELGFDDDNEFCKTEKKIKCIKSLTENDKRIIRLKSLIYYLKKSMHLYDEYNHLIRSKLNDARLYDRFIIDKSYITDDIYFLLSLSKTFISFNDLLNIEVIPEIFYCIGDIDIILERKILLQRIAADNQLFSHYLKQLSIMILFYSRCDKNIKRIKNSVKIFELKINDAIKTGKYNMLVFLDRQARINYI